MDAFAHSRTQRTQRTRRTQRRQRTCRLTGSLTRARPTHLHDGVHQHLKKERGLVLAVARADRSDDRHTLGFVVVAVVFVTTVVMNKALDMAAVLAMAMEATKV